MERTSDRAFGEALAWFPLVGLLLGLLLLGIDRTLSHMLPSAPVSALLLAALALLSGGLHLDGVADTADGMAVQGDRATRLSVMSAGNIGPAGVMALALVLLVLPALAPEVAREYFEIQRADPHVAVIVYFDGVAKGILPPMSTRAYWKTTTRVEFTLVDTRATLRVEPRILDQIDVPRSTLVSDHEIGAHEIGLLFVDGELTERLPPGRHAFWKATRKIAVQKFDLRPQPVEVTAQELLTKDRIGLRVTLTAFYRIVDPEKAMRGATDLQTALYRLIQFAVREAIATRTLDEILAARDRIDAEVRAYVGERAGELGVDPKQGPCVSAGVHAHGVAIPASNRFKALQF